MARINRAVVVGAIAAVLGFHTVVLGTALFLLGTRELPLLGALTAGLGLLIIVGGLWRAVKAWGADETVERQP